MELGSTEAVKEALRGGFGFSILSRISIRHELAEGSIVEVPIRGLTMERDFYEVSHKPPAAPSHRSSFSRIFEALLIYPSPQFFKKISHPLT